MKSTNRVTLRACLLDLGTVTLRDKSVVDGFAVRWTWDEQRYRWMAVITVLLRFDGEPQLPACKSSHAWQLRLPQSPETVSTLTFRQIPRASSSRSSARR